MTSRTLTFVLLTGILFAAVLVLHSLPNVNLPGNHQGYEPVQPIAYSHRLHAGELAIPCLYCHFGAQTSRHAGVPPVNVCMNCHKFVTTTLGAIREEDKLAEKEQRDPRMIVSKEIQKIYDAMALDSEMKRDPDKETKPVEWIKINNLPDFVYFDHSRHVNSGVACQTCHGAIETMERVRQEPDLSMGWCVNCHRDVNKNGVNGQAVHAAINCSGCHY